MTVTGPEAPSAAGPVTALGPRRGRHERPNLRVELAVGFVWFVLSYLAAMVAWVAVPTVTQGWHPVVVVSGSMSPSIRAGDIVLFEKGAEPVPGAVIAFHTDGGLVTHRVAGVNEDGTYQTKGDANRSADSTPVSPEAVHGVGRLLVPYIGFPRVIAPHPPLVMGTIGAVTGLAMLLVRKRRLLVAVAGAVLTLLVLVSSTAAFAATTDNEDSSFGAVVLQPATGAQRRCEAFLSLLKVDVFLRWQPSASPGDVTYDIYYTPGPNPTQYLGNTSDTEFAHAITGTLLSIANHRYEVRARLNEFVAPGASVTVTVTSVAGLLLVCAPITWS